MWNLINSPSFHFLPFVGYRPFVEACIDADEKGEALKYIPKLSDPRERAEVSMAGIYIQCDCMMCLLHMFFHIAYLLFSFCGCSIKCGNGIPFTGSQITVEC